MFHAYSGIFTKLHISRHIWDSDIFRILALPVQTWNYNTNYNSMVQSNVKQHLLFKSGSSFESLFRSIWNIFSFLSTYHFFLQDSISILRIACNPHYHTTHPAHATHASTPPIPPTLAPHPRKHATHVTHASIPPMPHTLARHPHKYVTRASTNSTPFLKLAKKKV